MGGIIAEGIFKRGVGVYVKLKKSRENSTKQKLM